MILHGASSPLIWPEHPIWQICNPVDPLDFWSCTLQTAQASAGITHSAAEHFGNLAINYSRLQLTDLKRVWLTDCLTPFKVATFAIDDVCFSRFAMLLVLLGAGCPFAHKVPMSTKRQISGIWIWKQRGREESSHAGTVWMFGSLKYRSIRLGRSDGTMAVFNGPRRVTRLERVTYKL